MPPTTLNTKPWSRVTIDNANPVTTPISKLALPEGPHDIHLEFPTLKKSHQLKVDIVKDTTTTKLLDAHSLP